MANTEDTPNNIPIPNAFCIMPWVHFHSTYQGTVQACCNANIKFGNINQQSIDEIWNGDDIKNIRQNFLENKKDNRCSICYNQEESGKKSLRQISNEKFITLSQEIISQNTTHSPNPKYYDIRFSNLCNLRCRTCWHGYSSKWHSDALALKSTKAKKALIQNVSDISDFINQFAKHINAIEEIYFAGGEPLIMQEHYDILKLLHEKRLFNIRIRYNTNLTKLEFNNHSILNLWKDFTNIEIGISIDSTTNQNNYIRKDSRFESLIENINQVKNHCSHAKLTLTPTISIFNIHRLTSLHDYFIKHKLISPNDVYLNLLERPYHYNICLLPKHLKQEYSLEIKSYTQSLFDLQTINENTYNDFLSICEYMHGKDLSNKIPKLKLELDKLDQIRNESFQEKIPELGKIFQKNAWK
ncbi:twitch domain-containing radical SAM protein [Aureibacter tunicatorum]|uniref:MoaA/NifB/PqqE/SkfB family radical SAM enzyme n=1 Tax=Aureibacter tunicatorum TaxID=866807 RepID=A0AAE3XND9_9BACT|nr:twitch domain-containing radical SAM protein [Aureibacter tunicatorum]MDR6239070.1 MoaA/NifB/PqqE/SkfB family radical SAM enzyme [Aureibacter tunicatorum]BDD05004.1 hypothetical protein AUTU_24870 [Aureibacter tunicatorum]